MTVRTTASSAASRCGGCASSQRSTLQRWRANSSKTSVWGRPREDSAPSASHCERLEPLTPNSASTAKEWLLPRKTWAQSRVETACGEGVAGQDGGREGREGGMGRAWAGARAAGGSEGEAAARGERASRLVVELRLHDVLVREGEVGVQRAARGQVAPFDGVVAPRLKHRDHLPPERDGEAVGAPTELGEHGCAAREPPRRRSRAVLPPHQIGPEADELVGLEDGPDEALGAHREAEHVEGRGAVGGGGLVTAGVELCDAATEAVTRAPGARSGARSGGQARGARPSGGSRGDAAVEGGGHAGLVSNRRAGSLTDREADEGEDRLGDGGGRSCELVE